MTLTKVFVGLGGNIGDTLQILQKALKEIEAIFGVYEVKSSNFYLTTPVEMVNESCFINAVCSFYTSLTAFELLRQLQQIERDLGKIPKAKNESRMIDLDILFFGEEKYESSDLEVPHPRWNERLFVLIPLLDLTKTVKQPLGKNQFCEIDLPGLIENFTNSHEEVITKINR